VGTYPDRVHLLGSEHIEYNVLALDETNYCTHKENSAEKLKLNETLVLLYFDAKYTLSV